MSKPKVQMKFLEIIIAKIQIPPTVALKRLCRNGKMVKNVMLSQVLNLIQDLRFQHLIESMCYETLKRVQGGKKWITTQSPRGEGRGLHKGVKMRCPHFRRSY